jgi:predicted N-formylglutamate amidohydrolase
MDDARTVVDETLVRVGVDPPAVEVVNATADRPILLLCDHAANRIPAALGDLGLRDCDRQRHIAWDPGAAAVTRRLAELMGVTAVLSGYSRLVLDVNRPLMHPESICESSDGTEIAANLRLSAAARACRAEACFRPYHAAVAEHIVRLEAGGAVAAIVAIHSFTPRLADGGAHRPWHVGVLWNGDGRIALPLLDALSRRGDLCVGDNQPYDGREGSFTVDYHGNARGRPNVLVEIRQDELIEASGVERWADILAATLPFG